MKKTKRWMIFATGLLCVGALAAAAACGADPQTPSEDSVGVTGSVLFLQDGTPDRKLGNSGDVCFVTSTGMVYRKDGAEWLQTEFDEYTVEGERLSVTYADGTFGTYEIAAPQADDGAATPCEHTDLGDPVTIYPALCVVPGIGVQTCSNCHESFVEILPADPANHEIDASNFGKCSVCGKLEDGSSGFVVDSSNVKNIGEAVEQLQDGDTLYLKNDGSSPEAPQALQFTAEHSLDIGENKNITVDVGDVDVTFTSGASSALSIGAGSSVTFKSEEGGTEAPAINLNSVNEPAVSVNGEGSTLNVEGMKLNVKNDYTTYKPGETPPIEYTNFPSAIVVQDGGQANIGGNTVIEVFGQTDASGDQLPIAYKEPQAAKVTGEGSVLNIEDTIINTHNATAIYAENAGTVNFKSGTINVEGGGGCAALAFGSGNGKIVFSGGTINIKGDLTGSHADPDLDGFAFAIGSTETECLDAKIIINGGTINLAPTYGTAIAVGGFCGFGDFGQLCYAYVGDGVKINLQASESGRAYVMACENASSMWKINVYADTIITGVDDERNFKQPGLMDDIGHTLCGQFTSFSRYYDKGVKMADDQPDLCNGND